MIEGGGTGEGVQGMGGICSWKSPSLGSCLVTAPFITHLCASQEVQGLQLSHLCRDPKHALYHLKNNRMGKTRDLFKKIRYQGTFHAKMGSLKDRNSMDLTEAEDIKKRWQEYPEELYKKDLHDPDNHDGVITHLGPDIL